MKEEEKKKKREKVNAARRKIDESECEVPENTDCSKYINDKTGSNIKRLEDSEKVRYIRARECELDHWEAMYYSIT